MSLKEKRTRKRAPETRRRVRRSPESARAHILAAAQRVFATHGPDSVGLKEVAREAKVSHGLITHYFGRYEALVEAVLEEAAINTQTHIVERLSDPNDHSLEELLNIFFDVMSSPIHGRLVAWAILSGRAQKKDFVMRRFEGPRRVADVVELRLRRRHPTADIDREEIDQVIGMVFLLGLSMSFGQDILWQSLGKEASSERRSDFGRWLANLIEERVATKMNIPRANVERSEPQ